MSAVVSRHIELLREELAQHRQAIAEIERLITALRSAGAPPRRRRRAAARTAKTAKGTKAKRTARRAKTRAAAKVVAAKPAAAPVKRRRARRGSYVAIAEKVLKKQGAPMRMVELIAEISKLRKGGGKYAQSAARQAITKAADNPATPIIRVGAKGSGVYGLAGG
jgi:hypothetical protein